MTEDGTDRLPPPHPIFSAHFTDGIYDPSDYANDDRAPFGNDEGFDEIHDWADRLDELRTHRTLRYMIGEGADQLTEELRFNSQVDVDDIVVALGFTLLRFTGQIDPEGRDWLLAALQRQDGRAPGSEYAIMLNDLASFERHIVSEAQPNRAERVVRAKRAKAWVSITGAKDADLETWFKKTARAVAEDPAWRQWWARSDLSHLVIHARPAGTPGQNQTSFARHESRLEVLGTSAELSTVTWSLLASEEAGHEVPPGRLDTPTVIDLFRALIMRLLRETGEHLGIGSPPDLLPG